MTSSFPRSVGRFPNLLEEPGHDKNHIQTIICNMGDVVSCVVKMFFFSTKKALVEEKKVSSYDELGKKKVS